MSFMYFGMLVLVLGGVSLRDELYTNFTLDDQWLRESKLEVVYLRSMLINTTFINVPSFVSCLFYSTCQKASNMKMYVWLKD